MERTSTERVIGGRFRLIRRLGQRSAGSVWEARDEGGWRERIEVVLLSGAGGNDPQTVSQFLVPATIRSTRPRTRPFRKALRPGKGDPSSASRGDGRTMGNGRASDRLAPADPKGVGTDWDATHCTGAATLRVAVYLRCHRRSGVAGQVLRLHPGVVIEYGPAGVWRQEFGPAVPSRAMVWGRCRSSSAPGRCTGLPCRPEHPL